MGNLGEYERNAYRRLIQHLIRSNKSAAEPFLVPVPASVPGYYEMIKQPMDLSTIRNKLDSNAYSSRGEFESDFLLMVLNAYTYNHPDNFVHKFAVELESSFRDLMQRALRDLNEHLVEERKIQIAEQREERKRRRLQLRRQASSFTRRSLIGAEPPLDSVEKKLEALERQLNSQSRPVAKLINNSSSISLSEQQKLQLVRWLEYIPAGPHLAEIRRLLAGEAAASFAEDDSLELDLERLHPNKQQALYALVKNVSI
jgi:hypothetical protein